MIFYYLKLQMVWSENCNCLEYQRVYDLNFIELRYVYWYLLVLLIFIIGIRIFYLINIFKNFQGIIKGLISGGLCKVFFILKFGGRFVYVFNKQDLLV